MCVVIWSTFLLLGPESLVSMGQDSFCVFFSVLFCRIGLFLISGSSFTTFLVLNIPGFLKHGCFFVFAPHFSIFLAVTLSPFRFPLSLLIPIPAGGPFLFPFFSFSPHITYNRQLITHKKHLIREGSPHHVRNSSFSRLFS